jgi:hypothetical protein
MKERPFHSNAVYLSHLGCNSCLTGSRVAGKDVMKRRNFSLDPEAPTNEIKFLLITSKTSKLTYFFVHKR